MSGTIASAGVCILSCSRAGGLRCAGMALMLCLTLASARTAPALPPVGQDCGGNPLPPEDYEALVFLFTLLDEVYVPVFGSPHEDCDEAPYLELLAEPTGPGPVAGRRHAPLGLEPFVLVVLEVTDAGPGPDELPPELVPYNFRWRHVEGVLQGPVGAVQVFGTVCMFTREGVDYSLLTVFDHEGSARVEPPPAPVPPTEFPPAPPPSPYPEWCPGIVVDRNAQARNNCKSLADWRYQTALARAKRDKEDCYDNAFRPYLLLFAMCAFASPNPLVGASCMLVVTAIYVWEMKACRDTYNNAKSDATQDWFIESLYCERAHPPDWECIVPQQEDPGPGSPFDGVIAH